MGKAAAGCTRGAEGCKPGAQAGSAGLQGGRVDAAAEGQQGEGVAGCEEARVCTLLCVFVCVCVCMRPIEWRGQQCPSYMIHLTGASPGPLQTPPCLAREVARPA